MKIPANHPTPLTTTSVTHVNDHQTTTTDEVNHSAPHAQNTALRTDRHTAPPQSAHQRALLNEIKGIQPRASKQKKSVAIVPDESVRTIPRALKDNKILKKYPVTRTRRLVPSAQITASVGQMEQQKPQLTQAVSRTLPSQPQRTQATSTAAITDTQPIAPTRRPSM